MSTATLDGTWIRLPKEVVAAAGLRDGDELQVEVEGPGELRVSTVPHAADNAAGDRVPEREDNERMEALLAENPGLLTAPLARRDGAHGQLMSDTDRERVAQSLSRGRSLVDEILEERGQGY